MKVWTVVCLRMLALKWCSDFSRVYPVHHHVVLLLKDDVMLLVMSFLTQLQISAELLTFLNSWRGKVQQSLALTQFNSQSCVSDSEQKHNSDRTPHRAYWPLAFTSLKCNWCRSPVLPSDGLEHCAVVWGAGRFMYVTLGFYSRGLQWPGGFRCPPMRQSANHFLRKGLL